MEQIYYSKREQARLIMAYQRSQSHQAWDSFGLVIISMSWRVVFYFLLLKFIIVLFKKRFAHDKIFSNFDHKLSKIFVKNAILRPYRL